MKIMDETIRIRDDGHYEAPLPFRTDDVNMPNNYVQAGMFSQHLKKRLNKDEDLHRQYTESMDKRKPKDTPRRYPKKN
jgi:hypothetical protein